MVEPGEFFSWIQRHQEQDRASNPDYIDAPFISNHDTTRVSAQCVNDERTMKLAAGLLMMMPGSPFVYYGEELGMKSMGTKDENKRLPMYWSDSDGKGMTAAPEGADEVGHIFPPADVQEKDENSIYHYYKEAVAVRNRHPEIARGTAEPLGQGFPEHTGAMKLTWEDRSCIIVCNNGKNAASIDLRKCLWEEEYRMTDMLMTGEQKAGLADGILTLPEAGIAVLEKG